jgi:hypothetical protein
LYLANVDNAAGAGTAAAAAAAAVTSNTHQIIQQIDGHVLLDRCD